MAEDTRRPVTGQGAADGPWLSNGAPECAEKFTSCVASLWHASRRPQIPRRLKYANWTAASRFGNAGVHLDLSGNLSLDGPGRQPVAAITQDFGLWIK
jgi:hypothetical protein